MRIRAEEGFSFREATDSVVTLIMERWGVSRKDALKLFAEAIVRNCVQEELFGEIDWLLGKEIVDDVCGD